MADPPTAALDDLAHPPSTDPRVLYRTRDEIYAADMLIAAVRELDLFTWLQDRPVGNADIERHFSFARRPVDVMTTLFASMGLLERDGAGLRVTAMAREHLVATSPWFMGPYFPPVSDRPIARDLLQILRTGAPARFASRPDEDDWHRAMESASFAAEFIAAMDCRGRVTAQALAAALVLDRSRRVLDVAGGSGIYACALAARSRDLRATVLEKPPVDRIAAAAIAARGFSARVDVLAGDMLAEPLPRGYDAHLFSNVLHDWDEEVVRFLLRASADALPAAGEIVIHDAFLDREKTGPFGVAAYSVLLMHVTQGRCYALSEMEAWLREAGFGTPALIPTALGRSALVARRR
jgi:hypothetical protein